MLPHNPLPALLLMTLAVLAAPLAAAAGPAAPPAPEYPGFYECSMFQIDWNHCDAILCARVWWHRYGIDEARCVPNEVTCDLSCICISFSCGPQAYVCSDTLDVGAGCDDQAACVQAWWTGVFTTRLVCVEDPCPDLACAVCSIGRCVPTVGACSELAPPPGDCAGRLVCVGVGWGVLQPAPACVSNPCTPGLAGCVPVDCHVDVCTVPYAECEQTVALAYGQASCTGVAPVGWFCEACPPYPRPIHCHEDTTGRVECVTTANPLG